MGTVLPYLNSANQEERRNHFVVEDCALAAESTGRHSHSLKHLRDTLLVIGRDSIFYHFWGGLLRPGSDGPLFTNDFAAWARNGLKDTILSERLARINPVEYVHLDDLRRDTIEIINRRLAEIGDNPWARRENRFHFIRSQIVVFDTRLRITAPEKLPEIVPILSAGSIFYHFIDARRRTDERVDDFRAWLTGSFDEYESLCDELANLEFSGQSLVRLRERLTDLFRGYFNRRTSSRLIG